MKRTIFPAAALALSLALSGSLAFAQQTQQPSPQDQQTAPNGQQPYHHHFHRPDAQRETAMLTRRLNLSPDQASRIEPIIASHDQQMAALWQNQGVAPQDKHQQMRTIEESTRQQLDAVLTPDQVQQMHSTHHGHRSPWGGPNSNQTPSPSPAPGA